MAAGPGVTGIEGWRVALLLVGFIVVTLSFEGVIDHVEKRLKKRKGLLTAFRALKNELLYLGFLSLLLSVTQEYLAMICIPQTAGSSYYKYKLNYDLKDHCAEGKEPLWPVSVQHETHYFIFAVAVTHILYCALTIALTLHKVGTWRPWEEEALAESKSGSGDVKVMQETVSRSLIRSMCTSALAAMSRQRSALDLAARVQALATSLAAQFRVSVSQPMYHNVRLMFIEKMGLTYDFDFHALVTNGMENQLAHVVHASWPLWMIAVVFLVLPTPSYVTFWSYGVVMLLMLVVGAKLVSVTALLGMQVAIKYGDSVLFGRMDLEPRAALVRARPARRRRMSLSQLADSLGDAVDGADGGPGGADADGDGGPGGDDDDGGGAAGAVSAGGGAHVLDEALPAGAGAEVAAQVAAITALTCREEALNLLRTMAAKPLLPDSPSPSLAPAPLPPPPELLLEPSDANAAAAVASTPAGVSTATGAAAGTPTLLPSPSLMLGIAPPRWGPPPPAAAAAAAAPPPLPGLPPARSAPKKKKSKHPPPVRLPPPPPPPPLAALLTDIRPLSPVLHIAAGAGGGAAAAAAVTATPVSPYSPPTSTLPSPLPTTVKPQSVSGDVAILVLGPGSEEPAAAAAAAADAVPAAAAATDARPSADSGRAALAASVRPHSAARPASATRPGSGAAAVPLSLLLPSPGAGAGAAAGSSAAALAVRPGSRGLNAVAAAASWANATARRNASRPSAGLMLCGVATSRATTALEQMEEALAIAATAVEMSAAQQPEQSTSPSSSSAAAATAASGGALGLLASSSSDRRPSTPSTVTGFLASLRQSRAAARAAADNSRHLVDGARSTDAVDGAQANSPRHLPQPGSRLAATLTRMAGAQLMSPTAAAAASGCCCCCRQQQQQQPPQPAGAARPPLTPPPPPPPPQVPRPPPPPPPTRRRRK
ncbi:hypothetical protein PLESTF_001807400 [Pleodorina starrii]|nr:hypothetical protein PLESTM_002040700 [Pleodorina starrii]GLC76628.1 hypothetical protein PLESTF_001807400 [Pleodorina starrii]